MKIAVIGAGNMGTAIAADLARKNLVAVHSSKPHRFTGWLHYMDVDQNEEFESKISLVSDNYEDVLKDAEIVFVTLPTQIIEEEVEKMLPYIDASASVGFVPGAGGIEFLSLKLIAKGCCVFGFERVPYVSRLIEYGKSVNASKKNKYRIAIFPKNRKEGLTQKISELFERPCGEMSGFMSMTLTPTLHISRLYDLYANYIPGTLLHENPYFYADWRDTASTICLQIDDELHEVTNALIKCGLDVSELVPYRIHYESPTAKDLTNKLRSIKSLSNIKGPVIENIDGTYTLDLDSRYFTESFPFRLCIVKGLAILVGIKVPVIDNVMQWYSALVEKEYFTKDGELGKDSCLCNIPQKYGIKDVEDLIKFYS